VRVLLAYFLMRDAGSAQDVRQYVRVAETLGHELLIYGRDGMEPGFPCSRELESVDAAAFIFEWTTELREGDQLDLARIVAHVPRERRVVIDCDGAYNDLLSVDGDRNHHDASSAARWVEICDSLADRIYQPTLHPLRPNVRSFFFHGYDPGWETPLVAAAKDFGMVYVGHSKYRWGPMQRVLRAIEPVRHRVGRIAVVGHGWDALPPWATPMGMEDAFFTDRAYLRAIGVEFVPPAHFSQVIPWMSRATFNPVIYRPLFSHLAFVTCRTFETPAAGTIPLFALDADYVREIYGDAALELVQPDTTPEEKIADIVERPEYYHDHVRQIRRHLAEHHSYERRVHELIEIVES
jgi:Glycosyl transferases group 1